MASANSSTSHRRPRLLIPILGAALTGLAACAETPVEVPGATLAAVPPLMAEAPQAGDEIPGAWIVQFEDAVSDVPGLANRLAAQHGGQLRFTFESAIRGFAIERLPSQAVTALQRNPNVSLVEPDRVVTAIGTQSPTPSWGLDRIDQRTNTFNSTYNFANEGAGVTAYILDTGIRYDHTEFHVSATDSRSRARFGYDAMGDGQQGADCNGHGTHVAGTVGGLRYGVAKQVDLVAVRVLGCNGSGSTSGIIAALDWMVKSHEAATPAVGNMSLGGSFSQSFNDAVGKAIADGIVMAVAAGNSNADACSYSPASAANAMTVGATGMTDAKASFSNFGNCVDFFAPGVSIVSATWGSPTATATYSGTSMASPHVAGAAALYLVAYPGSTPAQVRDGLFAETTKSIVTNANSANNHLLHTGGLPGVPTPPTPSPNAPPTAAFTYSCSGLTCSFIDRSSDSDGTIGARAWTFGDGASSSSTNPSRTYAASGSYQVMLTVTDDDGATASTTQSVSVTAPTAPAPVNIVLSGSPRTKGTNRVDLTWSGATASSIDVYRNGARVATVSNNGSYSDGVGKKKGMYTHQVCHTGTSTCSNSISTTF